MEKRFVNKLVTLGNGKQCVVLDETIYDGNLYILANEVQDNDLNENIYIFLVNTEGDKISFVLEQDLDICSKLLKIFDRDKEEA